MEIKAARRVHLQSTLTPIDLRGAGERRPRRPTTERAAELRQLAFDANELRELGRRLGEGTRTVVTALGASDPLALNRALADVDERVGRAVLRAGAELRLSRITRLKGELAEAITTAESEWTAAETERLTSEVADVDQLQTTRVRRIRQLMPKASVTERERLIEAFRSGDGVDEHLATLERVYQLAPPSAERDELRAQRLSALRTRTATLLSRHVTARSGTAGERAHALRGNASVPVAAREGIDRALAALGVSLADVDGGLAAVSATTSGLSALASIEDEPDTGAELTSPIGYLHLERVSYAPAGVEHGELVYSLPLGPGEEVAIAHKEWSNTEEEFQKLIADQFEDYSERGVVDKIDMAQASSSQHAHATQFSVAVSASGGFGPVSVSASSGFSASSSEQSSRQQSAAQSQSVTKKASARARKEHRTSFRLAKKTQVEDQTVRKVKNPDPLHPVRYDYYQLMRKWRVDLRRYGVRLTYDLTIPQPAVDLLGVYRELAGLDTQLELGFTFKETKVTRVNWRDLAEKYGVSLDPPPPPVVAVQSAKVFPPYPEEDPYDDHIDELRLTCPEGYVFQSWDDGALGYYKDPESLFPEVRISRLHGGKAPIGELVFGVYIDSLRAAMASVKVWFDIHPDTEEAWCTKAYANLREAANKTYLENRQMLEARRAQLLTQLESTDALTLRKLEREELMKGVLRWLFGPKLDFSPNVSTTFNAEGVVGSQIVQSSVLAFGKVVSFLHQAIEWENINYFLYPYFWTNPSTWGLRLRLRHTDAVHEAFLRAGASRVVLPIRRGWERAFLNFLETGSLTATLPGAHPYMTIAEELEAFANTNYPGIVSANPETDDPQIATDTADGVLIASWYEYTPTGAIDIKIGETAPSEGQFSTQTFAPPAEGASGLGSALANLFEAIAQKLQT